MDLLKWVHKNWGSLYKGALCWNSITHGLRVAGPCDTCHIDGICEIQRAVKRNCDLCEMHPFGCIYWEKEDEHS